MFIAFKMFMHFIFFNFDQSLRVYISLDNFLFFGLFFEKKKVLTDG